MGRPTKPTALKIVQGNPGKRALNKKEPKLKVEAPRMPAHLSPKAKTAWKGLCATLGDMQVLATADAKALELLCDAYADWRDLRRIINREGHTYTTISVTGDTLFKARPEVAMAADAWKRVSSMLAQFGLTPSSRSKVNATDKPDESDPLAEFLSRRKR